MSKLIQSYLLQQPIGKGVYGQVYKAIHQKSKQQFAVKVIPKISFKSNPKLQQLAINQISILSSLKHQNIVRFVQTLKTPNNFYFVYEYCNEGTLQQLLKKKKFLKQNQALIVFRQIIQAFKQLNKNNIMHRDLKPDNIFISNGKIKLGDFGFCKLLQVNMAQTMLGSPIYMAPQVLRQQIYTSKADIWSLGVVLFELLFGYCPFESNSISKLINVLKQNQLYIPKQINDISDKTQTLLKKMLVKDQFKRIQWVDLFDFKIDQYGHIISGYNKQTRIQAIQKYFLNQIKTVGEILIGSQSINNNKSTSNNTDTDQIKSIQIKSQKNQMKKKSSQNYNYTSLKKVQIKQNSSNNDINKIDSIKSQSYNKPSSGPIEYSTNNYTNINTNNANNNNNNNFSKTMNDYYQAGSFQPSEGSNLSGKQNTNILGKQNTNGLLKQNVNLLHQNTLNTQQNTQQTTQQTTQQSTQQNTQQSTSNPTTFTQKHSSWLQAIDLIGQFSEQNNNNNTLQNQKWIYWIAKTLTQKLNSQSFSYPQWTDVIMQQKQQLNNLIKQLDYLQINTKIYDKKNQLYKLWTKSNKKDIIQDKAIRFIFNQNNQNNKTVQQILLS